MLRVLIYFLVLMSVLSGTVSATTTNLGVVGKVYLIKERDALEEVQARARQVNWKKAMAKAKPKNYRPQNLVRLPTARKAASYLVDMTYTLDMDIPDGKGGILYPKGYAFNPLDYIAFRKTLVVINPEDPEQVAWFKNSAYAGQIETMLLISQGSYVNAAKAAKRPVFYANSKIVSRFNLQAVPSVVQQVGRYMRVDEILVAKTKGERP